MADKDADEDPRNVASATNVDRANVDRGDDDRGDDHQAKRRGPVVGWVLALIALGLMVYWNRPIAYQFSGGGGLEYSIGQTEMDAGLIEAPTRAGWPWRYWQRFEHAAAAEIVHFDRTSLGLNIAFTLLIVTLLCGIGWATRKLPRRLTITDVLLATSLAAVPFAFWQSHRRSLEPVADVERWDGSAATAELRPRDAERHDDSLVSFPIWAGDYPRRYTRVCLNRPDDQAVAALADIDELSGLSLVGGDYTSDALNGLPNRDQLQSVGLSGRVLDNGIVAWLATLHNVRQLSLRRTNVTAETLHRLYADRPAAAERLRSLDLVDTAVTPDAFSRLSIADRFPNLTELLLPRPERDGGGELVISGHRNLKTLSVLALDRFANPTPLTVRLSNLPELESILMDQCQRMTLDLKDLPKLQSITSVDFAVEQRLIDDDRVPVSVWCKDAKLSNLPRLEKFIVGAAGLESIRIDGVESLSDWGVMANYRQQDPEGGRTILGTVDEMSPSVVEAVAGTVAGVGKPPVSDLSYLPMGGHDLSAIADAESTQAVYLHDCGLTAENLKQIAGDHSIGTLSIHAGSFQWRDVVRLIGDTPNLEVLHTDLYKLQRLKIEDHEHIVGLRDHVPPESGPRRCHLAQCEALHLSDLPRWSDPIRVDGSFLRHLKIENLPQLKGLIINAALPDDATLSGLSGLETLVLGGAGVTDALAGDWNTMQSLNHLQLIETSLSPRAWANLLADRAPAYLDVRGGALDDKALSQMSSERLTAVHLESLPDVTAAGVQLLLPEDETAYRSLWKFHWIDQPLTATMAKRLAGQSQLRELALNGSGLNDADLRSLLAIESLRSITLADTELGAERWASLKPPAAAVMRMVRCRIDGGGLMRFARKHPNAKFELVDCEVPANIEAALFSADRIIREDPMASAAWYRGEDNQPIYLFDQSVSRWGGMMTFSTSRQAFAAMPDERFKSLQLGKFQTDVNEPPSFTVPK